MNKRKNIRLKGYNYSKNGYYYITICTQNRECILSEIKETVGVSTVCTPEKRNINNENVGARPVCAREIEVKLSYTGRIIEKILLNLENKFNNIEINNYIIMPNHIHVIIEINRRADTGPAPTIAEIICSFKTRTTYIISKEIKKGNIKPYPNKLWQRNYYEHIIRNEKEYIEILQYIINNPYNWANDEYH